MAPIITIMTPITIKSTLRDPFSFFSTITSTISSGGTLTCKPLGTSVLETSRDTPSFTRSIFKFCFSFSPISAFANKPPVDKRDFNSLIRSSFLYSICLLKLSNVFSFFCVSIGVPHS